MEKLPDKWHLRINDENLSFFKEYLKEFGYNLGDWSSVYCSDKINILASDTVSLVNCTEIYFQDFQKLVLNIIPDKIYCKHLTKILKKYKIT